MRNSGISFSIGDSDSLSNLLGGFFFFQVNGLCDGFRVSFNGGGALPDSYNLQSFSSRKLSLFFLFFHK